MARSKAWPKPRPGFVRAPRILPNDSARHVHWKASARLGNLMVREFTHEEDFRVLLVLDPHLPAGSEIPASPEIRIHALNARLRCAPAWPGTSSSAAPSCNSAAPASTYQSPRPTRIFSPCFSISRASSLLPSIPRHALMQELAAEPDIFKLIVTSQPHGTIPALLWHSSYVLFLDDFVD